MYFYTTNPTFCPIRCDIVSDLEPNALSQSNVASFSANNRSSEISVLDY